MLDAPLRAPASPGDASSNSRNAQKALFEINGLDDTTRPEHCAQNQGLCGITQEKKKQSGREKRDLQK